MGKVLQQKIKKTSREASHSLSPTNSNGNVQKDWCLEGLNPNDVVREFLPVIRRMATVLAARNPSSLDAEDLTSAGTIGLLAALTRYDPSREIKFRTYAEYRIRGMMLDEMRSMDWVPRSVRTRNDHIQQVTGEFFRKEGRQPDREEVATLLGITLEELEAFSQREGQLLSLEESVGNHEEAYSLRDVLPDLDRPDPFSTCLLTEMNRAVQSALAGLSDRQQIILKQYYYAGLTMKEIGRNLGLTESGVCRVHADAIRRLRATLKDFHETSEDSYPDSQRFKKRTSSRSRASTE